MPWCSIPLRRSRSSPLYHRNPITRTLRSRYNTAHLLRSHIQHDAFNTVSQAVHPRSVRRDPCVAVNATMF